MLRIKQILREKNLTMNDLADKLGVSRQALSKQVQGRMLLDTAEKIATALDVDMWELFATKEEVLRKEEHESLVCPKCGARLKLVAEE